MLAKKMVQRKDGRRRVFVVGAGQPQDGRSKPARQARSSRIRRLGQPIGRSFDRGGRPRRPRARRNPRAPEIGHRQENDLAKEGRQHMSLTILTTSHSGLPWGGRCCTSSGWAWSLVWWPRWGDGTSSRRVRNRDMVWLWCVWRRWRDRRSWIFVRVFEPSVPAGVVPLRSVDFSQAANDRSTSS